MADYYTQFSGQLEKLEPEEVEWLHDQLDRDFDQDGRPTWLDVDDDTLGFEWELSDGTLAIWSMEGSSLHSATGLVREFLERFRPDSYWAIEYANTCTGPKLDAFGGGAAFVTASEVEFHYAGDWLLRKIETFGDGLAKHAEGTQGTATTDGEPR